MFYENCYPERAEMSRKEKIKLLCNTVTIKLHSDSWTVNNKCYANVLLTCNVSVRVLWEGNITLLQLNSVKRQEFSCNYYVSVTEL